MVQGGRVRRRRTPALGAMADIRELDTNDSEAYRRLWLQGITEHSSFFRIAPEDEPAPSIPTRGTADSFTLGVFAGTELVGIVSLERERRAKLRHKALIFRMFVSPKAAGRGLGKALLQAAQARAERIDGLRYLYLTVLAPNSRAIQLYASQGFEEFAREIGSVKIGEDFVDELQMARRLMST